jgi:glycosyltransferase involved in cell wall biosynthesis
MDGISVVIPAGGRGRLHLLDATLASIRNCAGVDQIILSEFGPAADSLELAQKWGCEHVLTRASGPYERAVALNAGARLARRDVILWTDGDFLFEPNFMIDSQAEFLASGADYFYGHSAIHYLAEQDSNEVLGGWRYPASCRPIRVLDAMSGNPGGLGFVRASFAHRTGGMVEGFKGWGSEDHAWLHKAQVLGRAEVTRSGRLVWHLFHGDSGSHTVEAWRKAAARNPHSPQNWQLFERLRAANDRETYLRNFPVAEHAAVPWPISARIAFAVAPDKSPMRAMAEQWAARLHRLYGLDIELVHAGVGDVAEALEANTADAVIGFAHDDASASVLAHALQRRNGLIVLGEGAGEFDHPYGAPTLLAQTADALKALQARGLPTWHRPWSEDDAAGLIVAPPVIAPLSHLVGRKRSWKVRIELDPAVFPDSAFDRPRFWYVGLHDAGHTEIARQDLGGAELKQVVLGRSRPIVIERAAASSVPPTSWTVWPTDRHGRWLGKLSGPAQAEDLGHSWA